MLNTGLALCMATVHLHHGGRVVVRLFQYFQVIEKYQIPVPYDVMSVFLQQDRVADRMYI